jgi:ADP-ribosylarginine hydrolase
MYCIVVGILYNGDKNRDMLIKWSIELCKILYNNALSYLSGVTSALFIAFAIEKVNIHKWIPKLIELLESDKITKYVDKKNNKHMEDYTSYIRIWKTYLETRFLEGKPIISRIYTNIVWRIEYYFNNFFDKDVDEDIGITGYCSLIIAYDALIDAGDNWEKLLFYSMIHIGNSSASGFLAGAFYGALYGEGDIPKILLDNIQDKSDIIKIAKQLFKNSSQ